MNLCRITIDYEEEEKTFKDEKISQTRKNTDRIRQASSSVRKGSHFEF